MTVGLVKGSDEELGEWTFGGEGNQELRLGRVFGIPHSTRDNQMASLCYLKQAMLERMTLGRWSLVHGCSEGLGKRIQLGETEEFGLYFQDFCGGDGLGTNAVGGSASGVVVESEYPGQHPCQLVE